MTFELIPIVRLAPNAWNPNRMTDAIFESEIQSICDNGFLVPIQVRTVVMPDGTLNVEIIDGEHRLRGAKEIIARLDDGRLSLREDAVYDEEVGWLCADGSRPGRTEVVPHPTIIALLKDGVIPAINLGNIATPHAKRLTVIMNETRGEAQAVELSLLFADLYASYDDLDFLSRGLPFDEPTLQQYIGISDFDWDQFNESSPPPELVEGDTDMLIVRIKLSRSELSTLKKLAEGRQGSTEEKYGGVVAGFLTQEQVQEQVV